MGETFRLTCIGMLFLLLVVPTSLVGASQDESDLREEEETDYYEKWLKEDVVYIITDDEEEIFNNLTTEEEKERFIEQFWRRRDPNLRTAINEFKEEHYRRIAYANDHFSWALPGWTSDRGRVYIIHGPPSQVEDHSGGGDYNRPMYEGGGSTKTFPFYLWRYRHIPGIGPDVRLEFVDECMCGDYELTYRPEQKDAFRNIPGLGLTEAEEMGGAFRRDRPYFNRSNRVPGKNSYPLWQERRQDNPFVRYQNYVNVGSAPEIKYQDLKEIVEIDLSYDTLPLQVREDHFKLNEDQHLVPVTVEIPKQELTFEPNEDSEVARLAIYGLVTSLGGEIINEFEEEVTVQHRIQDRLPAMKREALYQKILALESNNRYKLDLVVKDLTSGKTGAIRRAIVPRASDSERLSMSSLILADEIVPLSKIPDGNSMFILGDVKVRPRPGNEFFVGESVGAYFQVYNAALDQSSYEPQLTASYRIWEDGKPIVEYDDPSGDTIQFYSTVRTVFVEELPTKSLGPGKYRLEISVRDQIKGHQVETVTDFELDEAT